MTRPTLVIVSGLPASGKTTLARQLAGDLRLPLIGRDDIKERLFDSLGWSDREWSKQLGRASWNLLWWAVETQLAAGASSIVESNFDPALDSQRVAAFQHRYHCRAVQIHCHAEGSVLVERFLARVAGKTRHPGHVDDLTIDEYRERLLAAIPQPLEIDGPTWLVDTTNPATIDYDWLLSQARSQLMEQG